MKKILLATVLALGLPAVAYGQDINWDDIHAGSEIKKSESLLSKADIEYRNKQGSYLVVLRPIGQNKFVGKISVMSKNSGAELDGNFTLNDNILSITKTDSDFPPCTVSYFKKGNSLHFKSQSDSCVGVWTGHGADFTSYSNSPLLLKTNRQ